MITRSICFRFDVDTPRCLLHGMPALLDLARELDVRFSFFIAPGRTTLPRAAPRHGRGPRAAGRNLSNLRKLGPFEFARTAIRRPRLSYLDRQGVVRRAVAEGHVIGLKGGSDNAGWRRQAHTWTESRTGAEIQSGLDGLRGMGASAITAFASPGWNSPANIQDILPEYGISIIADRHGHGDKAKTRHISGKALPIAVEFTGEPGGIGYLEWLTARGMDRDEALSHFAAQLDTEYRPYAVLFEHACFAGLEGLALLREMVVHCKRAGTAIRTMAELASTSVSGAGAIRERNVDNA